jgi:hypothetical protein
MNNIQFAVNFRDVHYWAFLLVGISLKLRNVIQQIIIIIIIIIIIVSSLLIHFCFLINYFSAFFCLFCFCLFLLYNVYCSLLFVSVLCAVSAIDHSAVYLDLSQTRMYYYYYYITMDARRAPFPS